MWFALRIPLPRPSAFAGALLFAQLNCSTRAAEFGTKIPVAWLVLAEIEFFGRDSQSFHSA